MEPLIAPVLDFVCPSSWDSNPEWISCLHSFLLACKDFIRRPQETTSQEAGNKLLDEQLGRESQIEI